MDPAVKKRRSQKETPQVRITQVEEVTKTRTITIPKGVLLHFLCREYDLDSTVTSISLDEECEEVMLVERVTTTEDVEP